jgi:ABC-type uncharacterized transport system involved in gliding motility auxiliary subunit
MNLRNLKYGSHASLFTLIVLAVVIILYLVAMRHNQRFDVTGTKRFTLAAQTVKVLDNLQIPVEIIGFFQLEDPDRDTFKELLERYAHHTDKLSYELVDPDRQPAMAKRYDIMAYKTVVVLGQGKQEKFFRLEEAALTNAILKVTRQTNKVVYFVTGHGEPSITDSERTGYSLAKQKLEDQNYTVKELAVARQGQIPDEAAVVIIAGPHTALLDAELSALTAYIKHGGSLLFLLDPQSAPNVVPFLHRYGFILQDDTVIETNPLGRLAGGDYLMPAVMTYEQHPITRDLRGIMTLFPVVRSVRLAEPLPEGVEGQTLASTSSESWAETNLEMLDEGRTAFDKGQDTPGPISIAAAVTVSRQASEASAATASQKTAKEAPPARSARLVVVGDSEFASNNFFPLQADGDFFLNTVSWLAEEEDLIAIRAREGGGSGPVVLTAAQQPLIFWIPVVLLPLAVFATGGLVFFRRRWQQ